jgi:hypothetical protein
MARKLSLNLPHPVEASGDCLPHAAMALGNDGGSGLRPRSRPVSRLVIEEQMGQWVLYRMDDCGGFVGDSWHETQADAIGQAQREFGVEMGKT